MQSEADPAGVRPEPGCIKGMPGPALSGSFAANEIFVATAT